MSDEQTDLGSALVGAYPVALRTARRLGYTSHERDDLVQDAMLKVLTTNPELNRGLSAYVKRAVLTTHFDRCRQNGRRNDRGGLTFEDNLDTVIPDKHDTPYGLLERKDLCGQLVPRLSAKVGTVNAQLLLAIEGEEITYAAAAERFGLKEGTVKSTIHRLRRIVANDPTLRTFVYGTAA
ncbi:hypothetical protein COV18_05715 [Candidatus Woesearchaeota archaeon CG10_big_fil_rev_8_21_14_0_10_37_12]|nr:MAG: hypothetical protein COV18_05715 [Candidatus Woesearchaeota archaeon CG10_big_fil_rev_8_21_14_0_10_37_12]